MDEQARALRNELWAISQTDSLRGEVGRLIARRRDAYGRARAHRSHGQLVPASLCEELAQNSDELRWALGRYNEARRRP